MKMDRFFCWLALSWMILGSAAHAADPLRVGLVLDKGGKDDKSFNSAALQGVTRAKDELKIQMKYVEATDDNAYEPMLRAFAEKKFDLVVAVGFAQAEALRKVAKLYPAEKFAIVDGNVDAPNVRALLFQEQEGSYLVGALAALTSKAGKIGFVGGMDIPLIRRFEMGYDAGAKAANPKVSISSGFVGVTGDAWNNPAKAKELALSQYASGADVVFAAAGASNAGVFDAAEEKKGYAIGCDSNQNWVKPGVILSSMLKRVDVAVFDTVKDTQAGKFTAGTKRFGLANQGVDYAVDKYNEKLIPAATRAKVEKLKAGIISGAIKVPDYYLKHK